MECERAEVRYCESARCATQLPLLNSATSGKGKGKGRQGKGREGREGKGDEGSPEAADFANLCLAILDKNSRAQAPAWSYKNSPALRTVTIRLLRVDLLLRSIHDGRQTLKPFGHVRVVVVVVISRPLPIRIQSTRVVSLLTFDGHLNESPYT